MMAPPRRCYCLLLCFGAAGAFGTTKRVTIRPSARRVISSCWLHQTNASNVRDAPSSGASPFPAMDSGIVDVMTENTSTSTSVHVRSAASWHKERRKAMLERYGETIAPLERHSSSHKVALPLLLLTNALLLVLALWSGTTLSTEKVVLLAVFPGSLLSLWQLQILHDVLHGSFFPKTPSPRPRKSTKNRGNRKRQKKWLEDATLFWGSLPCAFGYYLYLKFGHLTHHKNVGDPQHANLEQLFESDQVDFEDGDVLFVSHRMKLKGNKIGPRFTVFGRTMAMSISNFGFRAWRRGNSLWNACMFASSFLFERAMLVMNDVVVAVTGRNLFFNNKPQVFHDECARYARCATLLRAALLYIAGWKSLLFLYLSETLWSLPPHPACAMFVTNHGSKQQHGNTATTNSAAWSNNNGGESSSCVPTSSTYAGRWYSLFTLGTNYHTEHHDFPTIPLHKLGLLHKVAPEFYPTAGNRKDNIWQIMHTAFAYPDFYACMNAGIQKRVGIDGNDSTDGVRIREDGNDADGDDDLERTERRNGDLIEPEGGDRVVKSALQ